MDPIEPIVPLQIVHLTREVTMKQQSRHLLILALVVLLVAGCSSYIRIRPDDIPGNYEVTYKSDTSSAVYGVETLIIRPNGKYEQIFTPTDGRTTQKNVGKWDILVIKGSLIVTLHNWHGYVDTTYGKGVLPHPIVEDLSANPLGIGKYVEITINDDLDYSYKKKY